MFAIAKFLFYNVCAKPGNNPISCSTSLKTARQDGLNGKDPVISGSRIRKIKSQNFLTLTDPRRSTKIGPRGRKKLKLYRRKNLEGLGRVPMPFPWDGKM